MMRDTPARAARQHDDLVGQVDRLLDRVRDEQEGLLLVLAQAQQVFLELAAGLLVDGRERLVHEQHVGVDGERAGEADALAHAAGELVRVALLEAGEADLVDVVPGDVVALALRRAAQLEPEGDVADHGRPRHQGEILEHEGALRAGPGDAPAVDEAPRRRSPR